MTIHVVKKYAAVLNDAPTVYCGRGSALGNPYHMIGEVMRDKVCDDYEKWFAVNLIDKTHDRFHQQLTEIITLAKQGDVNLECYCAPKRCHCETIKNHVERNYL